MKTPKSNSILIKEFIELSSVALVGVSANPKRFGATAFKELKERGWNIIPVNPKYQTIQGETCYPDLTSIPFKVGGVISMVPKTNTLSVAQASNSLGIPYLWIQQMSESPEVISYCSENQMKTVFGKCILMYYPPVKSFHGFHRWLTKVFTAAEMP